MAARPYWSGQIRVSLVTLSVKLYSAVNRSSSLAMHMLHEPTGKRVHMQNVVEGVGPVPRSDIIKGYEFEKGRYVSMMPEELDELKLDSKKTIDIAQFVPSHAIPVLYYERPFFVMPEDELAEDAYVTIRDALVASKSVGLGQLTLSGRENLVSLKACSGGLILEVLRYEEEVRQATEFFSKVAKVKADEEKVELAGELIKKKLGAFDPGKFKDHYHEALHALIEAKIEHRKPDEPEAEAADDKVVDLMEALKRSLGSAKKPAAKAKKAPAKTPAKKAPAKRKGKAA